MAEKRCSLGLQSEREEKSEDCKATSKKWKRDVASDFSPRE
jgi:hypothetical protein